MQDAFRAAGKVTPASQECRLNMQNSSLLAARIAFAGRWKGALSALNLTASRLDHGAGPRLQLGPAHDALERRRFSSGADFD